MHTLGKLWSRTMPVLLIAVMLLAATPADAYRMIQNTSTGRVTAGSQVTCTDPGGFAHWTTASISWRHNTALQGSGKAAALQSAMASWTNVTGANHTLTYAGTTTAGWATDGTNTLLWASGNGCTGSCLALTALVLQSGQVIVESDVTFNNNQTWTTSTSTNFDTEGVAAHELGHALGIHHTELTSTTPRPTMYAFFDSGWRSLEPDDRAALQCSQSQYPVGTSTTLTFTSIGSEDGHITESTETSNVGGTVTSTATGGGGLKIGDTGLDRQRRSIVSFGTAGIPDGATILSAQLELRRGSAGGTSPFSTHSPCQVDIKTGNFGNTLLVASDFQAAATAVGVATLSNPTSNGALSTGVFNSAGRNAINKTGRTQLRIYCNRDDDDDSVSDFIGFYPGENSIATNRPKLVVTYQ